MFAQLVFLIGGGTTRLAGLAGGRPSSYGVAVRECVQAWVNYGQ
jgi:hypothetical protein